MDIIDQNPSLDMTVTEPNLDYQIALKKDPRVIQLSDKIKANDPNSIVVFGQEPAEAISRISDNLLAGIKRTDAEDAAKMITHLTKIMDKFDIKELEEPAQQGFLNKFMGSIEKKLDKLKAKYENLGKEVNEISIILNQHKTGLMTSNDNLKKLLEANNQHREILEQYIVAGMIADEQIDAYLQNLSLATNISENHKQLEIQQLTMLKDMLSQRLIALRTAEHVALQTAPMLQMMMVGNFNLMSKIQTSFITTLPIFKQSLIQAIELKRQAVTGKSLSQLDAKTAEIWEKNARNTSQQFIKSVELANQQALPVEKLKETYNIIQQGIQEAKQLNDAQIAKRIEDTKQLEIMKADMGQKGLIGSSNQNPLYLN